MLLQSGRNPSKDSCGFNQSVSPMIVCSCNVLSDKDVRKACGSKAPPRTAGQVYGCLGCSPQCGRCARTIRKIMDEALGACAAGCAICPQTGNLLPARAPDRS